MNARHPDPLSQPNVVAWFSEHQNIRLLANKVIKMALQYYERDDGRYINKEDSVEYRFGSSVCEFGDAQLFVTKQRVRARFWLREEGQALKSTDVGKRKTLKSGTAFAVEFIVADDLGLDALRKFIEANRLPGWGSTAKKIGITKPTSIDDELNALPSRAQTEVRREVWMRGSAHDRFKRGLKALWNDRCSVHGHAANALLVASHIWAWSECERERENPLNGLLLSVPLDKLFDRHLISFSDDGKILLSRALTWETKAVFAVDKEMRLRWSHIDEKDRSGIITFLAIHREQFQKKNVGALGQEE